MDDVKIYERAKFLRDHGRSSTIPYYTLEATPKYMPSNLQGAMGWAQLQRIDELVARKQYFFHYYKDKLSDIPDLHFNVESDDIVNGFGLTSLIFGKSHNIDKTSA